jgi:hypothetical protein
VFLGCVSGRFRRSGRDVGGEDFFRCYTTFAFHAIMEELRILDPKIFNFSQKYSILNKVREKVAENRNFAY